MKKVLISRYGAYGDQIHCSHLPRILKEKGFDVVDFETNFKGTQILGNNPFIDNLSYFEPGNCASVFTSHLMEKHWDLISQGYDKFINLYKSLEYACIAMEDTPEYYMHEDARKEYREVNFYDQTNICAGYPEITGMTGEVYFTAEETGIIQKIFEKTKDKFVVMVNLSGTTIHKVFVNVQEVVDKILDKYPDAYIITTGDESCKAIDIKNDRCKSIVGKFPFRQALHMTKYIDLLVSMESGLAVGANMFNTPTIQMMTSSSLNNHPKYAKNDLSLQSPAYCSPCSKGPYRFIGCPHNNGLPLCVYFKTEDILERVETAYGYYKEKRISTEDRVSRADASEMPVLQN